MNLSLNPDQWNEWIYDSRHPDYNSPQAKHMREARASAIRNAPEWMVREAQMNDAQRRED